MQKLKDVALGIITSIGGFIDAGAIITSAKAGAQFKYSLLWVVPFSAVVAAIYEEMAARTAMSTKHALFDSVRDRLSFRAALLPLITTSGVNLLTLVSEVYGMSFALHMALGGSFLLWSIPVVLLLWFILWKGSFSLIENGSSVLGLFILVFVWAAFHVHAPLGDAVNDMARPDHHGQGWALYVYSAIAMLGAYASPYQVLFYSSGAIEEEWGEDYKWANRAIVVIGNLFGALVAFSIIIVSAMFLFPNKVEIDDIGKAAIPVVQALGTKGFWLFVAGTFFCSMAAGLESALASTYALTEYFGWRWKKDEPPVKSALFHLVYMLFIAASILILVTGIDPLKVTETAMVFNAISLPLTLLPLLLIARDARFTRPPLQNGPVSNVLGWSFFVVLTILSIIGIPLFFLTGGGG